MDVLAERLGRRGSTVGELSDDDLQRLRLLGYAE